MDLARLQSQLGKDQLATDIKIATINLTNVSIVADEMFKSTLQLPGMMDLYPCFKGATGPEGKALLREYYDKWKEITVTPWVEFVLKQINKKGQSKEVVAELEANLVLLFESSETLSIQLGDILNALNSVDSMYCQINELEEEVSVLRERVQNLTEELEDTQTVSESE